MEETFPHLIDKAGFDLDRIELRGLLLSCVIGIHPFERKRKQPVNIDLAFYVNTRKAAATTSIYDTVDYSRAMQEAQFIIERAEFLLIETAADCLCKFFLTSYGQHANLPNIEAVAVRISKPAALPQGVLPTVQIVRRLAEYQAFLERLLSDHHLILHQDKLSRVRILLGDDGCFAKGALHLGTWDTGTGSKKSILTIEITE
jgi:dihydroneopterin aldolase